MTQTIYTGAYLPVVTGDTATWGTKLNTETFVTFDAAIGGIASQTLTNADVTLSSAQSGAMILALNGLLAGNRVVTTSKQGICVVENNTTGNHTVTYTNGTGASVAVPQGTATVIASDAVNGCFQVGAYQLPSSVALTGTLSVAGATTLTGGVSLGSEPLPLAEISTPPAPSSGSINVYGYAGDYLASQTPGGVQRLYGKDPTVQRFLSGTGTATPSTGAVRWEVVMCGGGGGGGGGNGGQTALGGWTANGANGQTGGTGGANGTGTLIDRIAGGSGGNSTGVDVDNIGGVGGVNPFGGAGICGTPYVSPGNGVANTGAGGGGNGSNYASTPGGGAGEYVTFQIGSPTALSYTVGAGASGAAGGNGGSGYIRIKEFYN
jgi:hypothetical protein